jgi:hypothetical protein
MNAACNLHEKGALPEEGPEAIVPLPALLTGTVLVLK